MLNTLFSRVSRLTMIVALLVATMGVAAALAWQAHQAARSHEAVAARVQQDYVEFAGWELARALRGELHARLERWLQVIACAAQSGPLPGPKGLASGPGCRCDDLEARTLFQGEIAGGALTVTGAPLGPEAAAWVLDVRRGERRLPGARHGHLFHAGMLDGLPTLLAITYAHDRFDAPVAIAGFAADPMAMAPAITHILNQRPLLPPSLAGAKNDMVRVAITSRDGAPLFGVDAPEGWARSEGALDAPFEVLRYQVALVPQFASQLVIGGLPRSRLPLLLGLLAMTAALLAVAVQQLRREHDLARLRADFVASVSHELRTPLAQIRLFSETLLLGRVRSEAEARRSLEIIQQESRRLTHLVENVLYFSRSERGVERLSREPTRLAEVAAELIDAFQPLARSGRSMVRLQPRAEVEVAVDRGALRQILLNLLDNAVKYGSPGQTITVGIDARGGAALLTVDDQGPGVPAEARTRIWQPYLRLATAASSAVAGTGIGLAVVRELAALHGGDARVEDAPGGGARFVVEFPGARTPAPEHSTEVQESGLPA